MDEDKRIWFPEPTSSDPTFAKPNEDTGSWLRRSTNSKASTCRRFLNWNLAKLPEEGTELIYRGLTTKPWRASFFELIVARTLQVLGSHIDLEPDLHGKKPDFRARFPSGASILVEATAPIYQSEIQKEHGKESTIQELIKEYVPTGWMVSIHRTPPLGSSDSKKELRNFLGNTVAALKKKTNLQEKAVFRKTLTGGRIHLTFMPKIGTVTVASSSLSSWWGNGEESIRKSIKRKRKQVRGAKESVILAIRGDERYTDPSDFDRAIFGCELTWDRHSSAPKTLKHVQGGEFHEFGNAAPTISAILVFQDVGFLCTYEPILYLHPRQTEPLPSEFDVLEQRYLIPGGQMSVKERNKAIMSQLLPTSE